jgi:hypothetical protein
MEAWLYNSDQRATVGFEQRATTDVMAVIIITLVLNIFCGGGHYTMIGRN